MGDQFNSFLQGFTAVRDEKMRREAIARQIANDEVDRMFREQTAQRQQQNLERMEKADADRAKAAADREDRYMKQLEQAAKREELKDKFGRRKEFRQAYKELRSTAVSEGGAIKQAGAISGADQEDIDALIEEVVAEAQSKHAAQPSRSPVGYTLGPGSQAPEMGGFMGALGGLKPPPLSREQALAQPSEEFQAAQAKQQAAMALKLRSEDRKTKIDAARTERWQANTDIQKQMMTLRNSNAKFDQAFKNMRMKIMSRMTDVAEDRQKVYAQAVRQAGQGIQSLINHRKWTEEQAVSEAAEYQKTILPMARLIIPLGTKLKDEMRELKQKEIDATKRFELYSKADTDGPYKGIPLDAEKAADAAGERDAAIQGQEDLKEMDVWETLFGDDTIENPGKYNEAMFALNNLPNIRQTKGGKPTGKPTKSQTKATGQAAVMGSLRSKYLKR